jgi:hypothetical protein
MSDQSVATLVTRSEKATDLAINPNEREVLHQLAVKVQELATRPVENEKRLLWYSHNDLISTRPLIFCDPENGWNEIITPDQLVCQNELARGWEMTLRKEIFWGSQMCDDRVIEPYFNISYVYSESDWGMHETKIGGEHGNAYTWESPLKDYRQIDDLHFPIINIDWDATHKIISLAEEIFDGTLKVRLKTGWWWSLGMTWTLVNLRGLSQMMFDITDHPDDFHRIMAFLRDGYLAKLDFLQKHRLLSLNNDGTYVGSGGFGWTHQLPQKDFNGQVRTQDMWGFSESQETVGVSPKMFAEFIFPYQLPVLSRFGLNCYGCCEPVDSRWQYLEKIPNLRRVSVSPWANLSRMAEYLGNRYIYSMKPNPADLAVPVFDEDRIRQNLREAMKITRNCHLEVIMKDNNTIHNEPYRAIRWVKIAREEAERV